MCISRRFLSLKKTVLQLDPRKDSSISLNGVIDKISNHSKGQKRGKGLLTESVKITSIKIHERELTGI